MKWIRRATSNYLTEDGKLWIHRYWADHGHKSATRNWWTLCVWDSGNWNVIDDVAGFVEAKKLAEQFIKEKS